MAARHHLGGDSAPPSLVGGDVRLTYPAPPDQVCPTVANTWGEHPSVQFSSIVEVADTHVATSRCQTFVARPQPRSINQ